MHGHAQTNITENFDDQLIFEGGREKIENKGQLHSYNVVFEQLRRQGGKANVGGCGGCDEEKKSHSYGNYVNRDWRHIKVLAANQFAWLEFSQHRPT